MRRMLTLLAVLALGASTFLMAADPAANQADKPAAEAPKEAPAEGTLFRSIFGDKIEQKTGIKVDYYMELGASTNNTIQKGTAQNGSSNWPEGFPGDTGFNFEQTEQFIHRDIKSNIIPRVTPTPAPMNKNFDWGFMGDAVYGRQAQPCRMGGFDAEWSLNQPGAKNPGTANVNRELFFCVPNLYGQFYLPFLKGIAITAGRFGEGLGYEIPPPVRPGPDFFYSHDYAFYSTINQVFGLLASANIYRSPKYGYLAGEFGVNNGVQTLNSLSRDRGFDGALRYRSPKMDTWIDYNFRVYNGNVATNTAGTALVNAQWISDESTYYHYFAATPQKRFQNDLVLQHEFRPHWKVAAEILYGKQYGDGAATTITTFSPAGLAVCGVPLAAIPTGTPYCQSGFKGAFYQGENGTVVYEQSRRLSWGLRVEQFRNPEGAFLFPLTSVSEGNNLPPQWNLAKGALNDITGGINYNITKYVRIRPELRYDWQSGNYGQKIFGQQNLTSTGTLDGHQYSSQVTASIDMVLYF